MADHEARSVSEASSTAPPPLPPRGRSHVPQSLAPDPTGKASEQWRSHDPRSSSMGSLLPSEAGRDGRDGRRTLLLIYIHGFMGNETSFQSFPAHVHNLLAMLVAESHVVHTKIYPRYKSRRAIEFARDDFSVWLEPHENPNTDVVLLGHSMGGLLIAEVALLPPPLPTQEGLFRHRVLGTINFDTPFLGMHPGLVGSGISSLFRAAPDPPKPAQSPGGSVSPMGSAAQSQVSLSTDAQSISNSLTPAQSGATSPLSTMSSNDPNYNPPFPNDVRLPERSGWYSLLHFVNKHADGETLYRKFEGLTTATKSYFMSHIEFGGCLADFHGLKIRYSRLRALEDVDDSPRPGQPASSAARVRFINYYTASTGIPKKPKPPAESVEDVMTKDGHLIPPENEMQAMSFDGSNSRSRSSTPTPRVSVDEYADGHVTPHKVEDGPDASPIATQMENLGPQSGVHDDFDDGEEPPAMQHIDSMPIQDDEDEMNNDDVVTPKTGTESLITPSISSNTDTDRPASPSQMSTAEFISTLPPLPEMPVEPPPLDVTPYLDKDARKLAEKDHKRLVKTYQSAVKDRENAIKDRRKIIERREKKIKQDGEKAGKEERKRKEKEQREEEKQRLKREKEAEKQRMIEEKEEEKRQATINPPPREDELSRSTTAESREKGDKLAKPKKDRKFCLLPSDISGKRDTCWVRVYMEGVDEVGAHCGLFFQGPQYESLVGDVGERIKTWVEEDASKRAVSEHEDFGLD